MEMEEGDSKEEGLGAEVDVEGGCILDRYLNLGF